MDTKGFWIEVGIAVVLLIAGLSTILNNNSPLVGGFQLWASGFASALALALAVTRAS